MWDQQAPVLAGLVDSRNVYSPSSQPVLDTLGSHPLQAVEASEAWSEAQSEPTHTYGAPAGPRHGARNLRHIIRDLQNSPTEFGAFSQRTTLKHRGAR